MDSVLRTFNGDVNTKEALKEFMEMCLQEEIIKRVYANEDVSGLADAKIVINQTFDKLRERYGIKEKTSTTENIAR